MSDAIDPEWAAWFTGFLEGDGNFHFAGSVASPYCKINLRNDDWAILVDISKNLGVGTVIHKSQKSARAAGSKRKDQIEWKVGGVSCLRVVDVVEAAKVDSNFTNWLAGFIDAEGSFRIDHNGCPSVRICLRNDDWEALRYIREKTKTGSLILANKQYSRNAGYNSKDAVEWGVYGPNCLHIVQLSEGKMKTKKAKDFKVWAEAVQFAASQEVGAPGKREKMLEYKAMLEDARKYVAPSEEELQAVLGKVKEGT